MTPENGDAAPENDSNPLRFGVGAALGPWLCETEETEAKGDADPANASKPEREVEAAAKVGGVAEPDEDEDANTLPLTFANGELVDAYAMKPLYTFMSIS
jgi:hypothetical protein